jgi:hypothetical protein
VGAGLGVADREIGLCTRLGFTRQPAHRPRQQHAATLLSNGLVLTAAGVGLARSADLLSKVGGIWVLGGGLAQTSAL